MNAFRPFYVRKRIDVPYAVLWREIARCFRAPEAAEASRAAEMRWTPEGCALAVLSVRTAFDAMLDVVDWPAGSEVLMSAVTIPHMFDIVRAHGYVAVPLEVDLDSLEPSRAAARALINERTRCLVLTHLFGARIPTDGWRALCDEAGLLFVEDRAQAFDGVDFDLGSADVALYSFGTIKTTTCFGGGIALIAEASLRDAMRTHIAGHPAQPTGEFLRKIAQYAVLIPLSRPRLYPIFCAVLDLVFGDFDSVVRGLTRGFPDASLLARIRRRPCAPLAAMLAERLATQHCSARSRAEAVSGALDRLPPGVRHLGGAARRHTHWLVPIQSRNPAALVAACRAIGLDATTGSSTLASHFESGPSHGAMAAIVYLPIYAGIPDATLTSLLHVLREHEAREPAESRAA